MSILTPVEVIVLEHYVAVSTSSSPTEVVLSAGQAVSYSASGTVGPARQIAPRVATAWQRGRLLFDNVPLSTVITELNRYRHGVIVIANEALARRTVSGVFRIDELDAALDTIIAELDLRAVRVSLLFTLLY